MSQTRQSEEWSLETWETWEWSVFNSRFVKKYPFSRTLFGHLGDFHFFFLLAYNPFWCLFLKSKWQSFKVVELCFSAFAFGRENESWTVVFSSKKNSSFCKTLGLIKVYLIRENNYRPLVKSADLKLAANLLSFFWIEIWTPIFGAKRRWTVVSVFFLFLKFKYFAFY